MKTTITVTTVREDGTPFATEIEVGETAQKHVLRAFNPSADLRVDFTKALCAGLIEQMIRLRDSAEATAAQKRAASIAITQAEGLQMQAVKANFVQA